MNADFPIPLVQGLPPARLVEVAHQIVPDDFFLEALLLVGSLAEGLASATSDIDLIMLLSGPGEPPMDEVALEVDGVLVDVQIQPLAAYAARLEVAGDWDSGGERAMATAPFNEDERTFLHRLLSGKYLVGSPDRLAPRAVREAAQRTLLRLKFDTGRHYARARLVDAHGCYVDGDMLLAAAMADDALHFAVDALTGALGESNINPKWRLRHLRRLEREGKLPQPVGETIARLLMGGVEPTDEEACAAFAARATSAVRALLVAATTVMDLGRPLGLETRAERDPAPSGKRLRLDLDFHVASDSTQLRLLSADRPPIDSDAGAIETVFLRDPDAQLVVRGSAAGAADPAVAEWLAQYGEASTLQPAGE